jgi:hypothetical protein
MSQVAEGISLSPDQCTAVLPSVFAASTPFTFRDAHLIFNGLRRSLVQLLEEAHADPSEMDLPCSLLSSWWYLRLKHHNITQVRVGVDADADHIDAKRGELFLAKVTLASQQGLVTAIKVVTMHLSKCALFFFPLCSSACLSFFCVA